MPAIPATPEYRSMRARKAAHTRWSREDPAANVQRASAGFLAKFLREVDPDQVLPDAERLRRANHALKAHMLGLAMRSAQARSKSGKVA